MTVDAVDPSAGTVDGEAAIVDAVAEGAGVSNMTVTVCVSVTPSVTSVAVKTTDSGVESENWNEAVPSEPVTADVGVMSTVVEGEPDNDTVFPLTGLPPELRSVTVMGFVPPTSTTDEGVVTVELPGETARVPNVTDAVAVSEMLSVVSVAEYVTVSVFESTALNVATPLLLVVADVGVTTELPPDSVRATAFPATGSGFAPWSRSVTVIVEAVTPSAATCVGLAEIVECAGDTTGAANVTDTVWVMTTSSVVSVAEYTTVSAVASVAVKTAVPSLAVVAEAGVMTEPPLAAARVTVLPETGTELASKSRTVMVSGSTPSATGEGGTAAAVTDDVVGSGAVGAGGALPSPGLAPVLFAVGVTKKGWDQKCGCVKSVWSSPM
jgi:hypothetical protein